MKEPAESVRIPWMKTGNSDAFFREKYLTKNMLRGNGFLHTEENPVRAISEEHIFSIGSFQIHHIDLEDNALAICFCFPLLFLHFQVGKAVI